MGMLALERDVADAHLLCQTLQIAGTALAACKTVGRVVGEHKFHNGTTGIDGT